VVDGSDWIAGVVRGCGTATVQDECSTLDNQAIPELHLTDATVELCYCTVDLCNSTSRVFSGHIFIIVAILHALVAAARLLSG